MRIRKFLFTCNRVFKHNEVVSNQHDCTNENGKMWASTRILNSTHRKKINIFFNRCRDVQQSLLSLHSVKMISKTHKYKSLIQNYY